MDNNRSSTWYIKQGDYINHDLDHNYGPKREKEREELLSRIYNISFVTVSFLLMLLVLQLVAKV